MSKHDALVFVDTETLGLDPDAPIWEFAAIRREADGKEYAFQAFFDHDLATGAGRWTDDMPEWFVTDYETRYDHSVAMSHGEAAAYVYAACRNAHFIGACPSFDTIRLDRRLAKFGIPTPWHYHLQDVEVLGAGYLRAKGVDIGTLPWKSDDISTALGVDPEQFSRHTAMGDVMWARAQWDAVMAG